MAGQSRSKNGVASLAYVPAIHAFDFSCEFKTWMPGTRPGMTSRKVMAVGVSLGHSGTALPVSCT
jgi:hypothetical protein